MHRALEAATDPWGVHVDRVEIKDVRLPQQMQRSMAAEAEATRDARAKVCYKHFDSLYILFFYSGDCKWRGTEIQQSSERGRRHHRSISSSFTVALSSGLSSSMTSNTHVSFPLDSELHLCWKKLYHNFSSADGNNWCIYGWGWSSSEKHRPRTGRLRIHWNLYLPLKIFTQKLYQIFNHNKFFNFYLHYENGCF